jgi:hypothetical protein
LISLPPTTVGRIKDVFDTDCRDAYQHHLVVDGGGVYLAREERRQRKSRKRLVSTVEIEQKLVAIGIGAYIATIVGFKGADGAASQTQVLRVRGIGSRPDVFCL